MNPVKAAAKRVLGSVLKQSSLEWIAGKYCSIAISLLYLSNPVYRHSLKRLKAFKDKHKGKRCFIIGNGPSLKGMDLSPLKNELTFGLNRIYLLFDRLGFNTTYYVSVNKYVIEQSASDIEHIPCPKFISWHTRDHIRSKTDVMFIRSRNEPGFCANIITQGAWEGTTVTYVAMQLAYYMGFSEVVLIGVDHIFKTKGEPHKLVVSQGEDLDHFDPAYFGKGFKWQLPDVAMSEKAYILAREAFEKDGRKIVDATVGGKLQVFPKVDYEEILSA